MSDFADIEKRRPNWGKREWLGFAELQTKSLDNATSEIARLTDALEQAQQECMDWQLLVEEMIEYNPPSDEHHAEFSRLSHSAVSAGDTDENSQETS